MIRRIYSAYYQVGADDVILVKSNQPTVIDFTAIDPVRCEGKEFEIVNANSSGDVTTLPATETIAIGCFLRLRAVDSGWRVVGVKSTAGAGGPHTHPISDVVSLASALAAKVETADPRLSDARTPTAHTHAISEIANLGENLATKADLNDSRFSDARTPLAHGHAQSDVTGLTAALNSKCASDDSRLSDARTPLAHTHAQGDITGLVAALSGKQSTGEKGQVNGYASLGADGKVPSAQLPEIGGASLPAGMIVMWSGLLANIPSGWALCDGQNGTPDLRGRFIKGAAAEPGQTGGALTHAHANHSNLSHSGTAVADHASHTHTYSEVVNHTHAVTVNDPGHNHTQNAHSHVITSQTATTGSATSYEHGTLDTSSAEAEATEVTGNSTATNNPSATGITATTNNPAGGIAQGTTNGPSATLSHSVTQPNDHTISAHDSVNHEPLFFTLAFIIKL